MSTSISQQSREKTLLIAAAALIALSACTKNETVGTSEEMISFQATNYRAQTKAFSGSEFTYPSFGVYAWSVATAGEYFMDNEIVTLQGGKWLPSTTYYWPKEATVDFISYNPRVAASDTRVKVEPAKITYTDYAVGAATVAVDGSITTGGYDDLNDLMYADKVVGMSSKTNAAGLDLTDGKNAYKAVPAFFRHALAKLNINVCQAYRSKTIIESSGAVTKYKWTVKVNGAALKGIDTKGSLVLNLSDEPSAELGCLFPWIKPENELWSGTSTPIADLAIGNCTLDITNQSVLTGLYVMPQALSAGKQRIVLNMTITTYRSTDGSEPTEVFLNETCNRTIDFYIDEVTLPSWKMNHDITYNLVVVPTADPINPGGDPDDPHLDDIVITFDPAVADWSVVGATATIKF